MRSTNKRFNIHSFQWDGVMIILIALLTAIASEFKVIPFNGGFRFGLGGVAFLLLILIRSPRSLLLTGFVTGLTVVGFRLAGDLLADPFHLIESLQKHVPAFLFYFLYALGLKLIQVEKYKASPLLLGVWATAFEFVGNGAEQLIRQLFAGHVPLGLREWALLSGVAVFRSFFVVGLYSSMMMAEQKKRMQEMLGIGSELYAESLYLQKSMNHIEQVTAASHDLYRKLKHHQLDALSIQALAIAQEIHEVKKDSQRILSGLSKITQGKSGDIFLLSELLHFVISANEKYSELLKRKVDFQLEMSVDFETDQHIPLLALLNNITANAVESIQEKGKVDLRVDQEADDLYIAIQDTGKGISKDDLPVIFEAGYTTKFNEQGVAATGIGLSHVQQIVQMLEGDVVIETPAEGTIFHLRIPIHMIQRKGD